MARNVLLIEPNYKNKFPPIALMKLATYHKRLGDNVVFFKGEYKDFVLNRLVDECIEKLIETESSVNWNYKRQDIYGYIKTRKTAYCNALELEKYDTELELRDWLLNYKDSFWKGTYLRSPEWDRICITTLFTFYFDTTVKCINDFKQLVKPDGSIIVGGVLATLQPEELEAATGIKPLVGLLNKPGDLDDGNDMIIDNLPLDYSILDEIDYKYEMSNAYYGSATKGCIRHCGFCAVSKLQPEYVDRIPLKENVERVTEIFGAQKDLILMDNNVMASEKFDEIIEDIIESGFGAESSYTVPNFLDISIKNLQSGLNDRAYIRKSQSLLMAFYKSIKNADVSYAVYSILEDYHLLSIDTTTKESLIEAYEKIRPYHESASAKKRRSERRFVDFNQGVDARLFTPHMAKQFSRIAINPLRIAFDKITFKDSYVNAIEMCQHEGLRKFSNYLLYNFDDDPIDLYRRLEININLCEELDVDIYSFPMKYHPLYGEHSHDRNFIGEKWNMKYIRAVQAILNVTKGCIGRGSDFFHRAFGDNEKEYYDILLMPDTLILYRFFFEWLESKNHPVSTYKWKKIIDSLTDEERRNLLRYLNGDNSLSRLSYIEELKPFYVNMRDHVSLSGHPLNILKKEFDAIPKEEKGKMLSDLKQSYRMI